MIICQKHAAQLEQELTDDERPYFIEALGTIIIKYIEKNNLGEKYEYNWNNLEKHVHLTASDCIFCYAENKGWGDFYEYVKKEFKGAVYE